MSYRKLFGSAVGLTLVMLFLVGCGAPEPPTPTPILPTATPTQEPPTATPTPIPPTATPTPIPSTPAPASTPTLEPQAHVMLAWHEAWNNKDIDAFMALVADDAVLDRGPYGVITGKEKIQAIVTLEMKENLKAKVSKFEVEGNQVTYYYEVFIDGRKVDQGFAVAIVENGKIKSDLPAK